MRRLIGPLGTLLVLVLVFALMMVAVPGSRGEAGPPAQPSGFQSNPTSTPTRRVSDTPRPSDTPRIPTDTPTSESVSQPTEPIGDLTIESPTPTLPSFTILTPTPIIDPDGFFPDLTGPIPTATPPQFVSPGLTPDLIAYDMEVTQGLQSLANHMPLAAGRLTFVRIYVETDGQPYPDVKGIMQVSRDGQVLGVLVADNQPIVADGSGGERINTNDSLYFGIPWGWVDEGTLHFEAFVYAGDVNAPFDHEPESFNNFIQTSAIFHEAAGINLSFIPIHLHQNYDGGQPEVLFTQDTPGFWTVLLGMMRHLPLPSFSLYAPPVDKIYCGGGPEAGVFEGAVPIGEHGSCEFNLQVPGGAEYVTVMMALVDAFTDDPVENLHYYGMVHPNFDGQMTFFNNQGGSISYSGLALNGQAYGRMDNVPVGPPWRIDGAMTLAHELGHRLDLGHVECSGGEEAGGGVDPDYPWPAPDCSLANVNEDGFYGFDTYFQLLPGVSEPTVISNDPSVGSPNQGFPLMGYQKPQWIDAWSYCILLDTIGVNCNENSIPFQANSGGAGHASLPQHHPDPLAILDSSAIGFGDHARQQTEYLYITGVVTKNPLAAVIDQVIGADKAPEILELDLEGHHNDTGFELALVDQAGEVLAFKPIQEPTNNHDSLNSIPFLIGMGFAPGTAGVQIRQAGEIVSERAFSPGAPEVTLLSPNGGEVYDSPFEIQWSGSDPDGDELTYTLQYSPDGGQSWQAIAFGVHSDRYQVLSLNNLTGSEQAKIRVIASDGGNSAADESDGVFSLPNTPPMPVIQSPGHQAVFPQQQRVPLAGSATDREDGILAAEALSWESSLDGFLGVGDLVELDNLSPGNHVITLTAEDSNGATAQAIIGIVVDPDNTRPLVSDEELAVLNRILAAGPDYLPEAGGLPLSTLLILALFVLGGVVGAALFLPLLRSWLRR